MSLPTKPKLLIYLLAIFLAGGVSGGFIGYSLKTEQRGGPHRPPDADQMIGFVHRKLVDQIGITPEQWSSDISPIITNSVRDIGELDARNRERIREMIEASDAAILEKLTPEQKPRMQQMIEERRSHMSRHDRKPASR